MGSSKKWKKLKILLFAAVLFTATITVVISNSNPNVYPLINLYIIGVSQGSSSIIQGKMEVSSDYTFSGNIYETIVVAADNIVIDGRGYTLQGSGSGCGFNLTGRSNVTIRNVIVTGWQYGFYLYNSSNNTLTDNIANNNRYGYHGGYCGFYLSNSNNNTLSNNTANSNGWGFYLVNSSNNVLSDNTAKENGYSGFFLEEKSCNNSLSGNTAANNRWGGFHLYRYSDYNNLSGNTARYNGMAGFELWSSSYNTVTGNVVVDLWGRGVRYDSPSVSNIIENNTVTATGPSLLATLFYNSYVTCVFYQQSIPLASNFLVAGLLVALLIAVSVCLLFSYRRRKGVGGAGGGWRWSRDAFLTGAAGGIMGALTAVGGTVWVIKVYNLLSEINIYLAQLSYYTWILAPWMAFQSYLYHGEPIMALPFFYSSVPLFLELSFMMCVFLIVTSVLVAIGFLGTYDIGVGAANITGSVLGSIGIISGALLIIVGNLTVGYKYASAPMEMASVPFLPVPTLNFQIMWVGFTVLGLAFIVLGSAGYSIRDMTNSPDACQAAGILCIIGAIFFIIGGYVWPLILIIGFAPVLLAFILWSRVFYSSKEL
ncbi:MAG: nitrous oxide reductase family maturation protein NosD [Candidatus Freyarchaeota archaeon]